MQYSIGVLLSRLINPRELGSTAPGKKSWMTEKCRIMIYFLNPKKKKRGSEKKKSWTTEKCRISIGLRMLISTLKNGLKLEASGGCSL